MSTNLVKASTKLFIQMSGAPGAGKSTLARLLRPSICAVIIDHDVFRSSLLASGTMTFDQAAKQAYLLQWALARDVMEQGLNVIVDSTCNFSEVLTQGSALVQHYDYTYWYIECKVSDIDLLDRRLRSRSAMASQRTAVDRPPVAAMGTHEHEDAISLFTKWIENPCRPNDHVIIVDSTGDPDMIRDQILKQISC